MRIWRFPPARFGDFCITFAVGIVQRTYLNPPAMAIVQLQRAWYRPKQPVIHYVVSQRVLVRSRPLRVRNPRTKAQQANRSKMALASRFLAPLQDFAIHGFTPGERPNGRPVGAYHVALGHLLNNAMRREGGQWRIDYANVQLAEGQSLREYPVRVKRDGRLLKLSWEEGLPEGTHRIRLAFHSLMRGESLCLEVNAPKRGKSVEVILPKGMKFRDLHFWWTPVVKGKTRWGSKYLFLPEGVKMVVGWVLARKCMGSGRSPQKEGISCGYARGEGVISSYSGEVGGGGSG